MNLPEDITLKWLAYDPAEETRWYEVLSEEELHRMKSFGSIQRRRSFMAGRVALRSLLADRLACQPADVPLYVAPDGAVEVLDEPFHVSLSHAGDIAVAVVAYRTIGVDIEQVKKRREDLYRFILHPDEYALMDALGLDRTRALILCWSLKEATLKALRTGFRLSPQKLRLSINTNQQTARIYGPFDEVWNARYTEQSNHVLAVAYQP
jgi:4'-phosphopantetheinyl transferase